MDAPWWQRAVFYQIYPRSFASAGRRPTGDLAGIEQHLDHLDWLGVDAVWLSPFYPSPMADFGYDVSDHCDVDPLFGDLDTFDRLLGACHARGLRLLVDLVPNHTSDQHAWFRAARSSRNDPQRDWYVWRDGTPDTPPNNWVAAFTGGPAWTWDRATGQWYLHQFLPEQPDLNWANPEVVEAVHGVMRFWLDRGVDGFRIDVAHGLGKDPALPDDPPESAGMPHSALNDTAETHELLRGMRKVVDAYPGDRLILGEVFLLSTERVATYYGNGDELHLSFNFPPLFAPWDAGRWRRRIDDTTHHIVDRFHGWPTWVLSNHDNVRHRTRYGGSESRARAAAFLLLGLAGSPVLYAGEELGLEDAVIPEDRRVDPGGRDGCRAPIPWDGTPTTAGAWRMRGCRGRPSPTPGTSPRSARTRVRSSTSTAGCWPPAAPAPHSRPAPSSAWRPSSAPRPASWRGAAGTTPAPRWSPSTWARTPRWTSRAPCSSPATGWPRASRSVASWQPTGRC